MTIYDIMTIYAIVAAFWLAISLCVWFMIRRGDEQGASVAAGMTLFFFIWPILLLGLIIFGIGVLVIDFRAGFRR